MSAASKDNASVITKGQKRKESLYFGATHQQALELEVSLLQSLLKRNRCSHQRTKYYQRLSMSLAAIKRHTIPQLYDNLSTLLTELHDTTRHYQQKRKLEQIFWSSSSTSNSSNRDDGTTTKSQIQQLWTRTETIGRTRVVQGLPECLSRLEYAAQALFAEMVRGFFLPFCTVAVAAISRIRTLLLRLGKFALQEHLPQLQVEWKALLSVAVVVVVAAPLGNEKVDGKAIATTATATTEAAVMMQPNQLWGQEESSHNDNNGENDNKDDTSSDAFTRARTVLMTAVHEASVEFGSRTRAERTQSMLDSLGLSSMYGLDTSIHGKTGTVKKTEITTDAASSAREDEALWNVKMPPESPEADDTAEEAPDIGEAVRPRKEDGTTRLNTEKKNLGLSADGVDRNSEILQNLKAQNKKSKKEKKKKKRKGETSDSDAGSKKKRRSKKGDFFDNLFAK